MQTQLLRVMWDLSSLSRDRTCVPSSGRQIFIHWTTREVSQDGFYKVVMEPWGRGERRKWQAGWWGWSGAAPGAAVVAELRIVLLDEGAGKKARIQRTQVEMPGARRKRGWRVCFDDSWPRSIFKMYTCLYAMLFQEGCRFLVHSWCSINSCVINGTFKENCWDI